MTSYLADTSAWTNHHKSAEVEARWKKLVMSDHIEITEPVRLELLRTARSIKEYAHLDAVLDAITQAPIIDAVWNRAFEVFEQLARRGTHRGISVTDLLVAAAAEHYRCIVLHYDKDFDLIAEVTGQPTEWIAPRGSL